MEEIELISALKYCDDTQAYERIYNLHKAKVFGFFLKKTSSEEDAKDLLQNVFLRLWRYRKTMNEDLLIDQHLFQYAKAVYIDWLRVHKKQTTSIQNESLQYELPHYNPSKDIITILDTDNLLQLLHSESALNRQIFYLNKMEGYSYHQLSQKFSLSVKSIDNYINKTLKRLKKKL